MNKKGAELSFNVIIIAILVILVLVVMVSFFLGGFGRLADIIFGRVDSIDVATNTCTSNCQLAQTYTTDQAKRNSAYCRSSFKFDVNPQDGQMDRDSEGNIRKYYCYQPPINILCPGVDNVEGCKQ